MPEVKRKKREESSEEFGSTLALFGETGEIVTTNFEQRQV
jgi:hypothetical protein